MCTPWRGPLLIAALALLWGSNFAWIKISLDAFTPAQLTFGRMFLGAVVLCLTVAIWRQRLPNDLHTWAHLAAAALLANALPYLLFAVGETRVDSSIAGVVNATTPLWTLALVVVLRQGEPVDARRIGGFIIGLVGCVVLFSPRNAGTIDTLGVWYCLLAALSYAVSYLYMARYLAPRNFSPVVLSAAQLVTATGWTLVVLASSPGSMPAVEPRPWLALAALGIFGTGAAYVINYALIRTEGAAGASVVTYLVPVTSVALGAALLAEAPTVNLVAGAGLILAGVALTQRSIF
jgi:drug/metabolite transporter (DMT)-like permease